MATALQDISRLILLGCGGHARSVAEVALAAHPGLELLFVEEAARPGETIFGFPVATQAGWKALPCHVALGDNARREEAFRRFHEARMISVIAPGARLGRESRWGLGCFLAHGCHLGPCVELGDGVVVNTGAVLDHEVKVGSFSHIGPNATVSGRCDIGSRVFIGVGATVIDRLRICDDVLVGAGSTVVKDIAEPGTYVGSPARKIKNG